MKTNNEITAHSLYVLYEALTETVQQAFLQELLQNQQEKIEDLALYIACKQAKLENEFLSKEETAAFINQLPK